MRWGLGPVFAYEWLIANRRWQSYAARSFMIAALLIGMAVIWWSRDTMNARGSIRAQAAIGEYYFYALIGVQLALVIVAAPAATAGSICQDRARGTLAHMLTTDLSDSEIVLGKLAARLLPMFALVACSWPLMALSSLLGGIDPLALTLAVGVILAVALLSCTMALAISVWAKKPHEVIMAVYTFWIMVLLAYPIGTTLAFGGWIIGPPRWVLLADPFYLAFAPYIEPARIELMDFAVFFAITLLVSVLLALVAVWRMRPVSTRENVHHGSQRSLAGQFSVLTWLRRLLPSPSLDGNPVLWREWHRSRPSRGMLLIVTIFGGITSVAILYEAFRLLTHGLDAMGPRPGAFAYILQVMLGLLMLAALAPMSLSEEQQRGSLDVLLVTPLSTRAIIMGKWWGTFRFACLLAILPALLATAMAVCDNRAWLSRIPAASQSYYNQMTLPARLYIAFLIPAVIVAHGAAATSVGLALASWNKRQSRAVATSVCLFIIVAVAWPILILGLVPGSRGPTSIASGLASLSLIFAAGSTLDALLIRSHDFGNLTGWGTLWVVVVSLLAVFVLEFTVRTFDHRFDRMPENPYWPDFAPSYAKPKLEIINGED
jgi:ABC-type transport system involved in multi-copper enzyme maturation permease subunit